MQRNLRGHNVNDEIYSRVRRNASLRFSLSCNSDFMRCPQKIPFLILIYFSDAALKQAKLEMWSHWMQNEGDSQLSLKPTLAEDG